MSLDKLKESTKILYNPIKDIEKEYLDARDEYDKAWKNITTSDFKEYEKQIKPYKDRVMEKSRKYRMTMPYELKPIPNYGDLMTLKEFIGCVKDGGFIDYDGHGSYSDGKNIADIDIYPSDVVNNSVRKDFTHVVWFNK